MLHNWFARSRPRQRQPGPDEVPRHVILGHAGLAFTGLVCWVSFLASSTAVLAWLAIGFLAPAIGLGIAAVTVWTPYPARRPPPEPEPTDPRAARPGLVVTDEMLQLTLTDEALTSKLVDELVERMLADPDQPAPPGRRWQLAPAIPILHGFLAFATFLLVMLGAIAAVTRT